MVTMLANGALRDPSVTEARPWQPPCRSAAASRRGWWWPSMLTEAPPPPFDRALRGGEQRETHAMTSLADQQESARTDD